MSTPCILVTGGIRSGKSEYAERRARELGPRIAYLATGASSDSEMQERIQAHRARRPESWVTVEAGIHLAAALGSLESEVDGVLLDDLGGLVAAAMLIESSPDRVTALLAREEAAFWTTARGLDLPVVVVTSEVGLSLVPTTTLGRQFTDLLGAINQRWAAQATEVYAVLAGLPLRLK